MTDHIYGEESIKIKQTAKTDWVRSEFREQEKYRRNYYGTIFLEILLDKMQRKENVLYIETVRAPRVVRVKRRKKEPDTKKCNELEKQSEPVTKTCDEHKTKGTAVPRVQGSRTEFGINTKISHESRNAGGGPCGNQRSVEYSRESSMNVSKIGMVPVSGETILVWASGDILELSVMSELPEISGNYNARACMV